MKLNTLYAVIPAREGELPIGFIAEGKFYVASSQSINFTDATIDGDIISWKSGLIGLIRDLKIYNEDALVVAILEAVGTRRE